MTDPRRSAAARKAAATRRRRKSSLTGDALDAATRATEHLYRCARLDEIAFDIDAVRAALLEVGAEIDRRNGY